MQIHQGPLFTCFSPMLSYYLMHATWDIYGYLMVYAMLTVYSGNYAMLREFIWFTDIQLCKRIRIHGNSNIMQAKNDLAVKGVRCLKSKNR